MEHRRIAAGRGNRRAPAVELDDAMYGIHAIEEALDAGEQLRSLHVASERRDDGPVRRIVELARSRDVRVRFEHRAYFHHFPYKAHQGVVAFGLPFPYASLDQVATRTGGAPVLLVLLEHITDPHNAGAIIRTAECAGAQGVVLPERRSAGVNATVRKAAAGAAAHVPIARVGNLAEAIRTLKKRGVWVAGADAGEQAVKYTSADLTRDLALVIGAEGHGLSTVVRRECDYLVRIPMHGRIASLNASVAAAVLLYEAVRQRGVPTPESARSAEDRG